MRDPMFPGVELDVIETLHGGSRSLVRRVSDGSRTLILKDFREAGEGWVREAAALEVLPPAAPVPRLLASRAVPQAVALSDAGNGGSVADALLGADPVRAADAVVTWARTVATLHRLTAGSRAAFADALAARQGDLPVTPSYDMSEAIRAIEPHCADVGIAVPSEAIAEMTALNERLNSTGAAALTPGDTCPDNNVFAADGDLILIDFEGAEWRHIAWDVAYLTVPWPSCWCAWRMPSSVTSAAVEAYQKAIDLPYASTPAFDADVALASAAWAFVSAAWFLPKALPDDPPLVKRGPTRRAMIQHRLRMAAAAPELPAMASLARSLDRALTDRWGELPLAYAPAFAPAP